MKNIFLASKVFAQESIDSVIGEIKTPTGVDLIQNKVGEGNIGILFFISKMLKVIALVGGVWVAINLVVAAYIYLTEGGKAEAHAKVGNIITMSVIGLIIIIVSYTFAGLIGLIFFGDASYIINPVITTVGEVNQVVAPFSE